MSGVKFTGYQGFMRRLKNISNPPASAKDEVGKTGVAGLEANYKGNPLGWRALKPETILRKGHNRILYETGAMSRSYNYKITPYGAQLFTDDPKAMIHQRNRPHVVLRPEVRQEMLSALLREMLK